MKPSKVTTRNERVRAEAQLAFANSTGCAMTATPQEFIDWYERIGRLLRPTSPAAKQPQWERLWLIWNRSIGTCHDKTPPSPN